MVRAKFGTAEWQAQALDDLRRLHPTAESPGVKSLSASIKADGAARRFTATITTETMDRDREVLIPEGMDPSEFKRSGTIFWNHYYDMPIGRADGVEKFKGGWRSTAEVAARPTDYQGEFFPDFVWAMISQGMVTGVSVGFQPVDMRRPNAEDLKRFGSDVQNIITRWKLLEWSVAPLQSNTGAVITAVHKGLIPRAAAEALIPGVEIPDMPLPQEPEPKAVPVVTSIRRRAMIVVLPPPAITIDATMVKTLIATQIRKLRGQLY